MLWLAQLYGVVGLVFAVAFFLRGYRVIDPVAADAGRVVRLMWCPAAFALWPVLLKRWLEAGKGRP